MSLFLTPQIENNNDLMYKNASGNKVRRNNNKPANLHEVNDEGQQLLKKVYSGSKSFSNVLAKDRPAQKKYIQEKDIINELYIKIQNELSLICVDNISYTSKFLIGQSVPEDHIKWSVHIKETIMALLLHEEIYQKLETIGVTEEILDDMLFRLKELDVLKYKATEEKKLIKSLAEDESKDIEEFKLHYSELNHYFDLYEEDYYINKEEELDEAI